MDVLSNDWWGEPLDAMLSRILVGDLNQRLPGSTVYADSGAISMPSDATVEINLQRFDVDRDGALTGPNVPLYREAVGRHPQIHWQASGGIRAARGVPSPGVRPRCPLPIRPAMKSAGTRAGALASSPVR